MSTSQHSQEKNKKTVKPDKTVQEENHIVDYREKLKTKGRALKKILKNIKK